MAYYRRARLFCDASGRRSEFLPDLVPKTVTLRPEFAAYLSYQQPAVHRNNTPIAEVGIVPAEQTWSKTLRAFVQEEPPKRVVSASEFAQAILKAMRCAIAEAWQPSAFHIVQHSSGWDSRLISTALHSLRKSHGPGWIGDLLFVECNGEFESFLATMRAQRWCLYQYAVYNQGVQPNLHHEPAFDFSTAWRKLNGYCGYPVNGNWDPFERLHEQGVIPSSDRCQIVTGYGANEIGNQVRSAGAFGTYATYIYYHALSAFPLWGGEDRWIHPFYHLPFIRTWIELSTRQPKNYRQHVLQVLNLPWSGIPPIDKRKHKASGYFRLENSLIDRCLRAYRDSQFGQRFPNVTPTAHIGYHDWWGYWSLASLFEHLSKEGHELRFG